MIYALKALSVIWMTSWFFAFLSAFIKRTCNGFDPVTGLFACAFAWLVIGALPIFVVKFAWSIVK